MDRFLLHVIIQHPTDDDELLIMRLVLGEEAAAADKAAKLAVIPQQAILAARREARAVTVAEPVEKYMVALIAATRRPQSFGDPLQRWIRVGASPRGTLALGRSSRVYAWLQGRDHVLPDDVRAVIHDCLRHRLILSYEANAEGVTADDVIGELINQVAVA
jgi:MoxR-like ATPase